jgi:hypothetical protein
MLSFFYANIYKMIKNYKKFNFLVAIFLAIFLFGFSQSALADSKGDFETFNIDQSFDINNRNDVISVLKVVSSKAYFYVDQRWFDKLNQNDQDIALDNLEGLGKEFDNRIYPVLTSNYGTEWKAGIDNDERITVFFHEMKEGFGGYFNDGDEYPKIQNPLSNEREMVYMAVELLNYEIAKSGLAHEFTHLITFNQKDRLRGIKEDVWLNEARAEYAPSLLDYDNNYQTSVLKNRVSFFVNNPHDSLTEWQGEEKDYGIANIFIQYLVDHYGLDILNKSMDSSKVGIASLEEALKNKGISKSLSDIFTEWTIAVFINDCNASETYCYKNLNLNSLKITPSLIFLPSTQKAEFTLNYITPEWSGNWYRIIGGKGDLTVTFKGSIGKDFNVPYSLCDKSNNCEIKFLGLNNSSGEISINDFDKNYSSLTLIPSISTKLAGFGGLEPNYSFSISASSEVAGGIIEPIPEPEPEPEPVNPSNGLTEAQRSALIKQIKEALIVLLQQLIVALQQQILVILQSQAI